MAGVGKTTLARLVSNDVAAEHFNLKAWVCVSDDFDIARTTKAILESVTSQPSDLKGLNHVQHSLMDGIIDIPANFRLICEKFVKRCNGLPLAAIELNADYTQRDQNDILPVLNLSYRPPSPSSSKEVLCLLFSHQYSQRIKNLRRIKYSFYGWQRV
ncbi:hypothetical protein F2P56_013148 [Juglans regia]|uniref:NB-ARC domain-containing protein n=2 Tax=Juglans regia TaxID=51240 RepID=A0A833XNB8_JUGRE|nr:putative disease resistance RPP13-like protein 1 [Juglans regia]KAF5469048.1 hypothetical protein F2P56_013148 [Juglans regia]